jgi:hypothetical protein
LADLDDQTLLSLADLTREAALDVETVERAGSSLTRRRFLTATLAGGFVAATAGAVAVWQYGSGRDKELNDDVARLWGLVQLHDKLDDVGLDSVAAAGLAAVGAALDALAGASDLVKAGAQTVEDALKRIEAAFPTIRSGVVWLEGLVSDLSQRVHLLEDAIGRALNEVNPITQALGAFFNSVLDAIPLGGGQTIKDVLDRIGDIINSIPAAIANINVQILTPLRDDWFSDDPGKGLKGGLIEPIVTKLLDPLEAMTGQLGELLRHWEGDLSTPVKTALGQREAIYKEIADYRARYRLESPPPDVISG